MFGSICRLNPKMAQSNTPKLPITGNAFVYSIANPTTFGFAHYFGLGTVSPTDALALDNKMDDGRPITGYFVNSNNAVDTYDYDGEEDYVFGCFNASPVTLTKSYAELIDEKLPAFPYYNSSISNSTAYTYISYTDCYDD